MWRKTLVFLAVGALIGAGLMLGACAKKQTTTETSQLGAAPTCDPEEAARKKQAELDAQRKAAEEQAAKRAAREQQLAAAGALVNQIREFEDTMIHFDFDRSDLRAEAKEILKAKAAWLNEQQGFKVRIEGHCDDRGTVEYNLALGERRAQAAQDYLVALGVDAARVSTVSYGEERPIDPAQNEDAWAKNRRDEFVLTR